ncbi:MAG: cell division protein ZapA [Alphaproteobacteria bacterium]|nr:cell division protein ZapA [Alphaproteobacteria bacterium]
MSKTTIHINGRPYHVACDDGQEDSLIHLGRYMDKQAKKLVGAVGQISEPLLLVMMGLMISDELSDVRSELKKLKSMAGLNENAENAENESIDLINSISERIEAISERLENI